jgi:hypothetical protein
VRSLVDGDGVTVKTFAKEMIRDPLEYGARTSAYCSNDIITVTNTNTKLAVPIVVRDIGVKARAVELVNVVVFYSHQ